MLKTAPPSSTSRKGKTTPPFSTEEISISELKRFAQGWVLDCEIRQHSRRTVDARKDLLKKLWWWCDRNEIIDCDREVVRQFLQYCSTIPPGGRWGNPQANRPVSSGTICTWHRILKAFFNWIGIERNAPLEIMANIATPIDRPDAIVPFTPDQMKSILAAAKQTIYPLRDQMIVMLLFDTGIRASELCSLRIEDIDTNGRCFSIVGKGNKRRTIHYATQCARMILRYITCESRKGDVYLLRSERGITPGTQMTRSGLHKLIVRLGAASGINTTRCSPHTFRHTFAVEYLKNGGNQFSLMDTLGHSDTKMTSRYVNIAKTDKAIQQGRFSPMDNLK